MPLALDINFGCINRIFHLLLSSILEVMKK